PSCCRFFRLNHHQQWITLHRCCVGPAPAGTHREFDRAFRTGFLSMGSRLRGNDAAAVQRYPLLMVI
ncbi:MAG: hypothetical protein ACXW2U_17480, partial [Telluria sp.]